jgi:hypothetical protein
MKANQAAALKPVGAVPTGPGSSSYSNETLSNTHEVHPSSSSLPSITDVVEDCVMDDVQPNDEEDSGGDMRQELPTTTIIHLQAASFNPKPLHHQPAGTTQ